MEGKVTNNFFTQIIRLTLLSVNIVLLSGCWNNIEINQTRWVGAVGIDVTENGQYLLTYSVLVPSKSGEAKKYVLESRGKTVFEAIRNAIAKSGYKLNYKHLQYIALGDKLVKKEGFESLDFFRRDHELNFKIWLVVVDGSASKLLNTKESLSPLLSIQIYDAMDSMDLMGAFPAIQIYDYLQFMEVNHKNGYIAAIKTDGENFEIYKTCLIKDGKVVQDMNITESRGLMWITNKVKGRIINFRSQKDSPFSSFEVINSNTKIESYYDKEDKLKIKIYVKVEGNIGEYHESHSLTVKEFYQIQDEVQNVIINEIQHALKRAQLSRADIFGIWKNVFRKYPSTWKNIKTDWQEIFVSTDIETDVQVKLLQNGLYLNN
ncbi:Ger(x)C family spore germination protein [Paenibacillus oralis]|uniref:Ger(X)C family spore germination protein n=1 Tax=Paenibacillus oralis TaxID=2490856 RepID=A0A3P3UA79_9BACL|nr:Ger(x)C family spore germination protein [Paenibacillus oralis]